MSCGGIIGQYLFKDTPYRNEIVHLDDIRHFYLSKMQEIDLYDMWIPQDKVTRITHHA